MFKKLRKYIDIQDVLTLFGISMITYGIYLVYPPACLLFAGLVFCRIGTTNSKGGN